MTGHSSTTRNPNRRALRDSWASRTKGFTLIELMVTISLMVIIFMIAAPSFNEITLANKLGSNANDFAASAYLARSEATKRNLVVQLCRSSNGTSCAASGDWEQGWIVISGTTVFQRHAALPAGYKGIQTGGTAGSLSFFPIGVGTNLTTLTFCRASPLGNQERVVTINATGGASVTKTTSGSCP